MACGALFALAAVATAGTLPRVRYSMDWRYEGQLSFYMLAKARGYFEQEGVDLTLDSGAGSLAAINRVLSGSHDMATADLTSIIEFLGNNPGVSGFQAVYLMYNRSPFIIQALKKSGIRRPQDLAGRRMASPIYDSVRKAFPIYARAVGVDPGSITWLSVDAALRETMLARGEVDAVPGFEMNRLTLMATGVKEEDIVTFSYADAGVKLYGNMIIASARMIKENPRAVAAVVRAINRALIDTIADPVASVGYIRGFDPLADPKAELPKLRILLRAIDTPYAHENGLGSINPEDLDRQVDDVASAFALKTRPDAGTIFNPAFLPAKAERIPFTGAR
jgi:NitT/TauT family transport system substrate-binding protein